MKTQKHYPLWQQFVDGKSEWIGGLLTEEDSMFGSASTKIKDIDLEDCEVGTPHVFTKFSIIGENFTCSFNVQYGGVWPINKPDSMGFTVPMAGSRFYITKPKD
jgi:hypothetical protein